MKCYIISYDLRYSRDYESLINAIKAYGYWGKINESLWAVVTNQNATQIRNNLLNYIDNDDRLFVLKSGAEGAWTNAIADNKWLKDNLIKS